MAIFLLFRLRGLLASLLPTQAVAPVGKIGPVRIGSAESSRVVVTALAAIVVPPLRTSRG